MASRTPHEDSDSTIVNASLISPISLSMAGLIMLEFILHKTYTTSYWLMISTVIVIAVFALTHFIPQLHFSRLHKTYLVAYHLMLAFILIFILPALSIFIILWIVMTYLSEFFYKTRGLVASLAFLLVTLLLSVYHQFKHNIGIHLGETLVIFGVMVAVNVIITKVIIGLSEARGELFERMLRAQYEHKRLVSLINNMTEAVIAVDQEGVITLFNAEALNILNTHADLTGKYLSEILLLCNINGSFINAFELAQTAHDFITRSDLFMPLAHNERVALEITISRTSVSSSAPDQLGYLILLRDITEQKSLNEERDDFISVVSHELRTPITIVEADLALAERTAAQPNANIKDVQDRLAKAHEQVLFLSEMMNDLSTLSRAERKEATMELETIDLSDLLTELDTTYQPKAVEKGLTLDLVKDNDLPKIVTSPLYLKEILQNFITNAIKYTEQGGVHIICRKTGNGLVKIDVKDSGIGISQIEQDKVYDKFWRSEDPHTRRYNGTGLGLYVASKLAHRIGAQLQLESVINEGSTFSVLVPHLAITDVDKPQLVKKELENFYS